MEGMNKTSKERTWIGKIKK